jgi:hypothetical protein
MKTLSIQQPWATLICAGIKDVENRTWKAASIPGRILIHASAKKVPKILMSQLPEEWASELMNHEALGNITPIKDVPLSAIIGYVDVYDFKRKTDSLWDGGDSIKWMLRDAWLFDEPITGVKGKLGLFDYPLDENNLPPAHKVVLNRPVVDGDEICFPVSDDVWNDINNGNDFFDYDVTSSDIEEYTMAGENDNLVLKPLKSIMFTHEGNAMRFELTDDTHVYAYTIEGGKPYEYTSVLDGKDYEWDYIHFALGKKL